MSLLVRGGAVALATLILGACSRAEPEAETAAATPSATAEPSVDWSRCRFPGRGLPIAGRLFVVDGGPPPEGSESGRETIRRVSVVVPGEVSLLLTAEDATVWHVQVGPQTQLQAVLASGEAPQRISGQNLGPSRLERSRALGQDCGGYLLANGAGRELLEASRQVFGRDYDAVYGLRVGQVIIGSTESVPEQLAPSSAPGSE